MRAKRWIGVGVLALFIAFLCAVPGAWAQDYRFSVDRNISRVIVNADGSADIEYWLTYTCAPNAHPIDIVDVGMPNRSYDLDSAEAWYSAGAGGGEELPLSDIYKSEWLDIGVEVHLGSYTLQPGEQGTLHLRVNVAEFVYPDSADEAYASVEFAPHYYDAANVVGKTYLEIQFMFPPGVTNEETRYHDREFDEVDVIDDRIVFIYVYPDATGSETHKHGISFPASYVDVVHKAPVVIDTGGTSDGGRALDLDGLFTTGCTGAILLIFAGGPVLAILQANRRKMKYLPPELAVEGVGIKRGLTAVEAAILLEKPLNKVLTMILFGLLKKRAIIVTSEDPLQLEKADPMPQREWRKYEEAFIAAIDPKGKLKQGALRTMLIELIKSVNQRMKGFSRKETIAYYGSIVDRAWNQVTQESTPEVKSQQFDQNLEWMMMDDDFQERTERTFRTGPVFMPPWWAYYRPWVPMVRSSRTGGGDISTGRSSSAPGGRQITLPTLPGAAFASTFVGGMERTASGIVGRLQEFTSGVTQRTNPPPVSSSGSSHRSGGCACACACACAGCACACAGGGR
ncbi:MAG: hypothetical protein JXA09_02570 [Anaerolineae bacterium]|nr:hypothetical protein [Anaerolineae bacterium]